jgi:type II secretory pathway component PulF
LPQHTHARHQSEQDDLIQLHAQACNGLSIALRELRAPSTEADIITFTRALARAMRATTALKQACAIVAKEGVTA